MPDFSKQPPQTTAAPGDAAPWSATRIALTCRIYSVLAALRSNPQVLLLDGSKLVGTFSKLNDWLLVAVTALLPEGILRRHGQTIPRPQPA